MKIKISKEDTKTGNVILVNPKFPFTCLPVIGNMTSVTIENNSILLNYQAAIMLKDLLEEIQCQGKITAISGYRTQAEQEGIWNATLQKEGKEYTNKFVAVPGHSEHQTGLALDLAENKENIDNICPDFPRTGIFKRFRETAPKYGFIERYLAGKQHITGIAEEPWHFRYVGFPHSIIISEENMVLEEYIDFLKKSTSFEKPYIYHSNKRNIEISYLQMTSLDELELEIPAKTGFSVSGTNEGGVLLNLWKE